MERRSNTLSYRIESRLAALCSVAADDGMRLLATKCHNDFYGRVSSASQAHLHQDLRKRLSAIIRQGFIAYEVASTAARAVLAHNGARHLSTPEAGTAALEKILRCFPALRSLWTDVIDGWCHSTAELLNRVDADAGSLAVLLNGRAGKITDLLVSLSDRHNCGRTVCLLQFYNGAVVYKPRSGRCESTWFALLDWLNGAGFSPPLRVLRTLDRGDYHWVERVTPARCRTNAERRRFFIRAGAIACLAYLLRAKDWHCENLIAARDQPVIIDTEVMWHLSGTASEADDPRRRLRDTMLFATDQRPFGALGMYDCHSNDRPVGVVHVGDHGRDIVEGFKRIWTFLFRHSGRAAEFCERVQSIATMRRRRIYRSTTDYANILNQSLQPAVILSTEGRFKFLRQRCASRRIPSTVSREEVRQLRRADIPFFTRCGSSRRPQPEFGTLTAALHLLNLEMRAVAAFERTQRGSYPRQSVYEQGI
jgi:lantibiotic modifying enzyme